MLFVQNVFRTNDSQMRALPTLLLALVCLLAFSVEAKSRKSNHYKPTAADDHPVQPEPKASTKSSAKAESSSKSSTTKSESSGKKVNLFIEKSC